MAKMIIAKDITEILNEEGFETFEGYDATLAVIKEAADSSTEQLCSGWGVFPGGDKCKGCSDCRK